jgi:hypothetical protein
MNWLTVKYVLQKVWTYIKNYWWAGALIIVGYVLHKFFLADKEVFQKLYEDKIKQNDEEQRVIKKAHEDELKKIQEVQEEYKEVIKVIEEDRAKQGEKIKREEKKRIKEIVAMPENDRIKALADEFDLEIVEVEE